MEVSIGAIIARTPSDMCQQLLGGRLLSDCLLEDSLIVIPHFLNEALGTV